MVKINDGLDLRSSEFIASRRLFTAHFYFVLAFILSTFMITTLYFGLKIYADLLQSELLTEEAALQLLTFKSGQLTVILEEIALLEAKSNLENKLRNPDRPLSQLLITIREKAAFNQITIYLITIDHIGNLMIEGRSSDRHYITIFNHSLTELPLLTSTMITTIEMNGEDSFYFKIKGTFN